MQKGVRTARARRPVTLMVAVVLATSWLLAAPGIHAAPRQSAADTAKALQEALASRNAQPSGSGTVYKIVCRGLRRITLYYAYDMFEHSAEALPQGYLLVEFDRGSGSVGVGGSKLKAGECSWLDRRFKADEPSRILVPYVAYRVDTGSDGKTRTEVQLGGLWKTTEAMAKREFSVVWPVRRVGQHFVVPEPVSKMGAPTRAR